MIRINAQTDDRSGFQSQRVMEQGQHFRNEFRWWYSRIWWRLHRVHIEDADQKALEDSMCSEDIVWQSDSVDARPDVDLQISDGRGAWKIAVY